MSFRGIGPKTASWIVRNWYDSDDVAILDVHIVRAGQIAGVFPRTAALPRDYYVLEDLFLRFARAIEVRPSALDAKMWSQMRQAGKLAHGLLRSYDSGDAVSRYAA
jgi:thermostable 8-oxoguanine DNA glycosylase